MKIIPFWVKEYESTLSEASIMDRLRKTLSKGDWNFVLAKAFKGGVIEGEIKGDFFRAAAGKYALTYARSSIRPIMKGRVGRDKENTGTIIKVIVRFNNAGIIILVFLYGSIAFNLPGAIRKGDNNFLIFSLLFVCITYGAMIVTYNTGLKKLRAFIEKDILEIG